MAYEDDALSYVKERWPHQDENGDRYGVDEDGGIYYQYPRFPISIPSEFEGEFRKEYPDARWTGGDRTQKRYSIYRSDVDAARTFLLRKSLSPEIDRSAEKAEMLMLFDTLGAEVDNTLSEFDGLADGDESPETAALRQLLQDARATLARAADVRAVWTAPDAAAERAGLEGGL